MDEEGNKKMNEKVVEYEDTIKYWQEAAIGYKDHMPDGPAKKDHNEWYKNGVLCLSDGTMVSK